MALAVLAAAPVVRALPPMLEGKADKSWLSNFIVRPKRIVRPSGESVANLLKQHSGQAVVKEPSPVKQEDGSVRFTIKMPDGVEQVE